ncbi:hypothetical protein HDV64DRAFT_104877 [Trichoderma sp. TUCIM 5745]
MRLEFETTEGYKDWIVNIKSPPIMKFIDDRWPVFLTETPFFNISIQYTISKKTIYQEYSFELKNGRQIDNIPNMLFNADLLIRNLNFVESRNIENNRGDTDEKESFYKNHHNTRIIRKHHSLQTGIDGIDAVGLVIMPFINEQYYKIEEKRRNIYQLIPGDDVLKDLQKHGKMVVTIAYTLELMGSGESSPTPDDVSKATQYSSQAKEDLLIAKSEMGIQFETLLFAKERHLGFVLRRNLEHILSVCSIPIGSPSETGIVPIALTCGDMSNHRVMAGASFYAFEFLLLALQHLENLKRTCSCDLKGESCGDYKCRMRYRILRTCHGHLLWLYRIALQKGLTSHHWVSGEVIKRGGSQLAEKSITDLPFHIIKAADFCRIITDEGVRKDIDNNFKLIFANWIGFLHLDNKNNEHVFSRSKNTTNTTIHEFFFAEQAIIWRALKAGETFEIESTIVRNGKSKTVYTALDIQNSALQKFSCESPGSDKPMIAISRSPYGNTFKFKNPETTIFNAVDHGIFTTSEDSSIGQRKMELWMNTLDHQLESDERINVSLSDPLQAALAIIVSAKSRHAESDSMKRRHESAKFALLRSSSPNGLLSGQSDENQESISFNRWNAAFEIPYILWMYGTYPSQANESFNGPPLIAKSTLDTMLMAPTLASDFHNSSKQLSSRQTQRTKDINKGKVVEYPDNWLYSKPQFLTFEVDLREEAMGYFYEQKNSSDLGIVISKAYNMLRRHRENNQSKGYNNNQSKGYIVNVPEDITASKNMEYLLPNYIYGGNNLRLQIDPRVRRELTTYDGIEPRPILVNKRLLHFYPMDFEIAGICYYASTEAENLSLFFDRHATYDKYFYEDAQLIFNRWTTELHLSFYQVISDDAIVPEGISQLRKIKFPSFGKGDKPRSISLVSLSLRFDGDMFDSSWICHFLEFNPNELNMGSGVQALTGINTSNEGDWQERRILELLILNKMLDTILQSTKEFFEQLKRNISKIFKTQGESHNISQPGAVNDNDTSTYLTELGIFDKISTDIFVSMISLWYRYQHIIDIVEEDLKENITTIALWMSREEKRRDEPRWPESSEQKHGWTISQLSATNSRKFDELQRCCDSIKVFNTLLAKRMEAARSEWEIQSSNNIRLFTYVTVVFLPISFATSIFSMSDAPSENTLRHMITLAAVALGATIIALFNAKALDSKLVRPIYTFCRYILKGRFSLLYQAMMPCVYFAARYIYYPIVAREKSEEPSTKIPATPLQKPKDLLAELWEKARELFHEYEHPITLAHENFEKAKSQREETKQRTSAA